MLADLSNLFIAKNSKTTQHSSGATLRLAVKHGLTTYDDAYLELTLRRDLPLATLDQDLRGAAAAEGVQLLGL